jgi:very-short-patch-repair endonuclease
MRQLEVALTRLPPQAALSGLTAFWLHGLDVDPCNPIEATSSVECKRVGINVRRAQLPEEDVVVVRGMRITTVPRTLADLCIRLGVVEAVVLADMALHARLTTLAELNSWAEAHAGRRGVKRMRRVIALAEPASESPMETRLRLLLVLRRLPRPVAQVPIQDAAGRFIGRVDLFYERSHLAIEYDGAGHRDSVTEDNRRQNRLLAAGVRLLRFTASDVLGHPDAVVAQVKVAIGTKRRLDGRVNGAIGTNRGSQMKRIAS